MANNKVQLADGTVLIDLTDTTATASDVASGSYFYDAAGVKQAGTLTVDQTYSVTKTLTNVTTSVDDTKVIAGNSFFMDLTPNTGYSIHNITVTMGGVDITSQVFTPGVGERTIVSNGTYTASTEGMSGFSEVTVNVPNRYTSADEGKVVSSGALVAQTSDTVTSNGTVDTTLINSLTVNVSGGSTPIGTKQISITENGTVTEDVTDYANVEITASISGGNSKAIIALGGCNQFTQNGKQLVQLTVNNGRNRCSLWANDGVEAAVYSFDSASNPIHYTKLYPVTIPSGKTVITPYTASGSGQYDIFFLSYSSEWNTIQTTGWVNVSGNGVSIPSNATHVIAMLRVNSSNSQFTASNFPYDADFIFS